MVSCTKQQDCPASSHYGDCASMPSSPIYTQAEKDAAVVRARLECARDICPYCGSRALAFHAAVDGPNDAGNFTHQHKIDGHAAALCKASFIYARMKFKAASKEGMKDEH